MSGRIIEVVPVIGVDQFMALPVIPEDPFTFSPFIPIIKYGQRCPTSDQSIFITFAGTPGQYVDEFHVTKKNGITQISINTNDTIINKVQYLLLFIKFAGFDYAGKTRKIAGCDNSSSGVMVLTILEELCISRFPGYLSAENTLHKFMPIPQGDNLFLVEVPL